MTDLQNVGEDMVLHGCVMHTNGATANLDAVQHEVVVLAANLGAMSTSALCCKGEKDGTNLVDAPIVHLGYVLPHWRGKGVVGAAPAAVREELLVLVRVGEQRELGYPQEVACVGRERQVP